MLSVMAVMYPSTVKYWNIEIQMGQYKRAEGNGVILSLKNKIVIHIFSVQTTFNGPLATEPEIGLCSCSK